MGYKIRKELPVTISLWHGAYAVIFITKSERMPKSIEKFSSLTNKTKNVRFLQE